MIESIGILRALSLGDLLVATPLFRAIRKGFSKSKITLIGLPSMKFFFETYNHYFDYFLPMTGWPGLPEQDFSVSTTASFLNRLKAAQFNLFIQAHGSGCYVNDIARASQANFITGFYDNDRDKHLSLQMVPYPDYGLELERLLTLTEALKINRQGTFLDYPVLKCVLPSWLPSQLLSQPYVVVHPGASKADKQWSLQYFSECIEWLLTRGLRVVCTGTKEEAPLGTALSRKFPSVYDFTGQTSFNELSYLIKEATLLLCNDTSVSHLASAFKTKSIVLFISSEYDRWRSENTLLHQGFPRGSTTTSGEVIEALEKLLSIAP
jgi:ADP-heptose:LPS heptosyltransferase